MARCTAVPIAILSGDEDEHEGEGNRYLHIIQLTNHFSVPQDGCASYRLLMQELEVFVDALFEHIHLEKQSAVPSL